MPSKYDGKSNLQDIFYIQCMMEEYLYSINLYYKFIQQQFVWSLV